MRKNILVAFIAAMSLSITACGASENVSTSATEALDNTEQMTEAATVETESEIETQEAESEPTESSETDSMDASVYRAAYQIAMLAFMQTGLTPTGKELCDFEAGEFSDMSMNGFAICDVDNDGIEELLVEFTNATMAGMYFEVCQYDVDTGDFILELEEFPAVSFYDNGLAMAEWSHNQIPSRIWPYTLYSYDESSDSYVGTHYVSSWDKELTDVYNGNVFPEEVDTSKTGGVYYITEYGNMDIQEIPLDESVYNAFTEEKFGGANEIEIDYLSITEENIAAITD